MSSRSNAKSRRKSPIRFKQSFHRPKPPLSRPRQQRTRWPTTSFLKGEFEQRVANSNFRPESFDQAARSYREAIAHDPNFALAIAQLAMCQLRRHWLTDPLSEAEAELIGGGQTGKGSADPRARTCGSTCRRWSVSLLWLSPVPAGLN